MSDNTNDEDKFGFKDKKLMSQNDQRKHHRWGVQGSQNQLQMIIQSTQQRIKSIVT